MSADTPIPRSDQDDKAAWIREVKERWRPFWTPEMERVYAPERKRERGERRGRND